MAFEDLCMEAIYQFELQGMPVIIAVDVETPFTISGASQVSKRMAAEESHAASALVVPSSNCPASLSMGSEEQREGSALGLFKLRRTQKG